MLVAVVMLFVVGAMAALSIDVVTLYTARSEAQLAADGAALAGARVLANSGLTSTTTGPAGAEDLARTIATQVAANNEVGGRNLNIVGTSACTAGQEICVSFNDGDSAFVTDPHITVRVQRTDLPTFFARIWGSKQITVAASATAEGFAPGTIIFLDVEEGGRLPAAYHAYLRTWTDELAGVGYRSGVYCSGIPVDEGGGVIIITADDIHNNIGAREVVYWVYNDICPPSPGCRAPQNPPPVSASGVSYAAIWQTVRSPRTKELTARCATTYHVDGNCYAPGDAARAWFLDVNVANSPDPSAGAK